MSTTKLKNIANRLLLAAQMYRKIDDRHTWIIVIKKLVRNRREVGYAAVATIADHGPGFQSCGLPVPGTARRTGDDEGRVVQAALAMAEGMVGRGKITPAEYSKAGAEIGWRFADLPWQESGLREMS